MLKVQEYLQSGKTLDNLNEELSIEITYHKELPLVILNYNHLESPKNNPITNECRGLVLENNGNLVARSFSRFYNWGECQDEMPLFDWDSCTSESKKDGSLILIFYFDGKWYANTRGSFGMMPMFGSQWQADYHKMPMDFTWNQGFLKTLNINSLQELDSKLDRKITYVCEFCSPWNRVVITHKNPLMYLITCFEGESEIGPQKNSVFQEIEIYPLKNVDDITKFVNKHSGDVFEGIIVKDKNLRRWKFKNPDYVLRHRIMSYPGNLFLPKYLVPCILANDDELCVCAPEIVDCYNSYKKKIEDAYLELEQFWEKTHKIENQKEFGLAAYRKTPFYGVLFDIRRKLGTNQTVKDLKDAWSKNADGILKILFEKKENYNYARSSKEDNPKDRLGN